MRIMFAHYDEAVRSVAVHIEGSVSPIYLGPIEDPETVAVLSRGGQEVIAREFLPKQHWIESLSSSAGVDLTDAECAIFDYQRPAMQ